MTQKAEKSSQAISWDHYSQLYSCQHQQEWTQSIKTPHMLIKKKKPIHIMERKVCCYHSESMNSHSCWAATTQFWQRFRSGSLVLFRKEALIVWAMYSGIKKALTSTGTSRNIWAMTESPADVEVSAGNQDKSERQSKMSVCQQNLTNWSTRGSAFKLMVLETHNYADENFHWFQFFYVYSSVPLSNIS